MRNNITILMISLLLIGSVHSDLPAEDNFAKIYQGENVKCDGTSASIHVRPDAAVENEEGVVTAVAQAVAQAINSIVAAPTTATVVAQANAAAELVLEVVARAVASVDAEINSPHPGCWGIAFGKAQAVAVARATVTAIAEAFAEAQAQGAIAQVVGQVQNAEEDVQVTIEEIALLLADGSGRGYQSDRAVVEAVARARAVNCALAQAFAAVADGVAEAEVFAQVGCPSSSPSSSRSMIAPASSSTSSSACDCITNKQYGAPAECGKWGQQDYKPDYFCYVKDPSGCKCAVPSYVYKGMSWRYCGPTLAEMQKFLSFDDESNGIVAKPSGYGYCAEINHNNDKISQAAPPPTPTPAPVPTVSNCPRFRCIGDAGSCCSSSGPTCTSRFGSTYKYLGKCASTGKQIWSGFIECYCP